MARIGTPNLGLGTWLDGENPGAGSQTVNNTGLNGNWIKLDIVIGVGHNADGSHKAGIINTIQIVDAAITTPKIADANVTTPKIADGAIITVKIADQAVTTAKIADGAVGTTELLDAAVTTPKIVDQGVTTPKIADGAVTAAKLAPGAIDNSTIIINGGGALQVQASVIASAINNFKEYVANIEQGVLNPPTHIPTEQAVLKNDFGSNIVWSRSSAGVYLGTLSGAFTLGKTIVIVMPGGSGSGKVNAYPINVNQIQINTVDSGGSAADGNMYFSLVNIKVFN